MKLDPAILQSVLSDRQLHTEFDAICDCGGRLAGTESEARALDLLRESGSAATGAACRSIGVAYGGWRAERAALVLADGSTHRCHPLVRTIATPAGGLEAEVVDLGRGTPEEFEAHAGDLAGRIALVRHELMFVAGTIHRRRKYDMARARGAVGFLIAGPLARHAVAGSSGRMESDGIPAAGIEPEVAARLARTAGGWPRVRLVLETSEQPATTETLLFDMPGRGDGWVVLSAHLDGHDGSESAIDNASGLAVALAVARAVGPHVNRWRRGVRLAFFSVEEWALTGSAEYVAGLAEAERARIAMNVNLDSVAGSSRLAALTSGYSGMEPFLLAVAEANGHALRTVRPFLPNSDHANFAAAGIPAFRLVAGYDEPLSQLRYVLTPADTRDKVAPAELRAAATLSAAIVAAACQADEREAAAWRHRP